MSDDNNERDVIKIDLRQLDLPDHVMDELQKNIEKAVRMAVFNAGSRWGGVNWGELAGRTRGMVGEFPDGDGERPR